jgi:hypothetical protein
MTAKVAQRVAELRERRTAMGLVRMEVWVHPRDRAAVKAVVEALTLARTAGNRQKTGKKPA